VSITAIARAVIANTVIASEAKQTIAQQAKNGLLRRKSSSQ